MCCPSLIPRSMCSHELVQPPSLISESHPSSKKLPFLQQMRLLPTCPAGQNAEDEQLWGFQPQVVALHCTPTPRAQGISQKRGAKIPNARRLGLQLNISSSR